MMYSSPSVSKYLGLVPILVVVAIQLLMRSVSSLNMTNAYLHHKCLVSQGKYKPGSQDEQNLDKIIELLPKDLHSTRTGYGMMSLGNEPDKVVVTFQCRGDSYGPKCRTCFATAQSELRKRCPRNKGGIIWYDQCLVEFSSLVTEGQINYDDGYCMPSAKSMSGDLYSNEQKLIGLIDNVTRIAITKERRTTDNFYKPGPLYAVGETRLGMKKLYAMVQCTFDLSLRACEECVTHNILQFQDCYRDKQGARVLGRSCSFRFELYPFVKAKTSP